MICDTKELSYIFDYSECNSVESTGFVMWKWEINIVQRHAA